MLYPITLSSHKRIVIAPEGWFDRIGRLDEANGELTIGVNRLGKQGLAWFVCADGQFHVLRWRGLVKRGPAQWLGLSRQRELYEIQSGQKITCGELLDLVRDHSEQLEEAPHSAGLRTSLCAYDASRVVDREVMARYLGQLSLP